MSLPRVPPSLPLTMLAFVLARQAAHAQAVPTTPRDFTSRIVGGGTSTVGVLHPPQPQEKLVRTITYIALGDARQWKSSDGRSLLGKLIAFENVTVEVKIAANQQPQPAAPPQMPDKPTVVKDGKARLLIDNKPFEVPLERLSDDDQKFINAIKAAIDAKAAAKKN